MNDLAGVRSGYNRWAAVYDHDGNPLQALEEPILRQALGAVGELSALDLGCGTGRHTLWLAEGGARVTAVDFSEEMIASAQHKPGAGAVEFVVHDLHQPLQLADDAFDLVISSLVLEHLRELNLFFAEVKRVLQPSGRAVISAMHPAMFLREKQASFTDPISGEKVRPGSLPHLISDFVMAALDAGLRLTQLSEHAPDESLAARCPRAAKYIGWPMLVVLVLQKSN